MNCTKAFLILAVIVTVANANTLFTNPHLISKQFGQRHDGSTYDGKRYGGQCDLQVFKKKLPTDGRYTVEGHFTTTEDGYILQMFRVHLNATELANLSPNLQANISRPVHIQHGLYCDATSMIWNHEHTFSFYMIEKGFDVWFGNNRGTKFSLDSDKENITEREFFDFSFTEMGQYDVPAFYQEILKQYPSDPDKQIIYFGHSQGSSQMFVALSDPKSKVYVREHTELFFAISPIAFLSQTSDNRQWNLAQLETVIYQATKVVYIWEIGAIHCEDDDPQSLALSYAFCKKIDFLCERDDLNNDEAAVHEEEDAEVSVSGVSAKQQAHLAQLMRGGVNEEAIFRPFDYGAAENMNLYGQATPPQWDLSDWTTPTNLVIGENDHFGNVVNTEVLQEKLGENFDLTVNVIKDYGHSTALDPVDPFPFFKIINEALNFEEEVIV